MVNYEHEYMTSFWPNDGFGICTAFVGENLKEEDKSPEGATCIVL
jgi:hypothetical protein